MREAVSKVADKVVSATPPRAHPKWWQQCAIYQVYPRSFQDSNGDGVGDLVGVRERLDYLAWLGVDSVWLSPIMRSPMADFGYDVADYADVDPLFGSLADLDSLIAALHSRGMRLLLDLVPNHTSSEHPWFLDALSSRSAAHRDWYIWRDPRPDGSPPNGWIGAFGGSAWEWHEPTGQYYFHSFLKEQPDLNWENPDVRAAIFDVMRFWFRRGVDGFRIDVVNLLAKRYELERLPDDAPYDPALANDPARFGRALTRQRWAASPRIFNLIEQLRAVADEFDDRVLIGEIWLPIKRLVKFYGKDLKGLHMPFNFQMITIPWTPLSVHKAIKSYEEALPAGAWPNWVVGNHDKSRFATRVGEPEARVGAVLLLTLRGTPTMYYGDELGMLDVPVPREAQRDPQGLSGGESRDPERTPMPWDASVSGGFTTGSPWLPMGPGGGALSVEEQRADDRSMLNLYKRLLDLRREERALNFGEWRDLGCNAKVLAYLRSDGARQFLVAANMTPEAAPLPDDARSFTGRVVIDTADPAADRPFDGRAEMGPDQAIVVLVD